MQTAQTADVTGGRQPVFSYSGPLSESAVEATAGSLRVRLAQRGVAMARASKVFSTYVEMAYNVVHYGLAEIGVTPTPVRLAELVVETSAEAYLVMCRNRVSRESAELLSNRIDELRRMSAEQIRFAYRLQLTNLQFDEGQSTSKGAGLGLLTVARNAMRPIEYGISWGAGDVCLFNIHAIV